LIIVAQFYINITSILKFHAAHLLFDRPGYIEGRLTVKQKDQEGGKELYLGN